MPGWTVPAHKRDENIPWPNIKTVSYQQRSDVLVFQLLYEFSHIAWTSTVAEPPDGKIPARFISEPPHTRGYTWSHVYLCIFSMPLINDLTIRNGADASWEAIHIWAISVVAPLVSVIGLNFVWTFHLLACTPGPSLDDLDAMHLFIWNWYMVYEFEVWVSRIWGQTSDLSSALFNPLWREVDYQIPRRSDKCTIFPSFKVSGHSCSIVQFFITT